MIGGGRGGRVEVVAGLDVLRAQMGADAACDSRRWIAKFGCSDNRREKSDHQFGKNAIKRRIFFFFFFTPTPWSPSIKCHDNTFFFLFLILFLLHSFFC